jgi:anti-sigma regulatory factor (Ser/Thr protein kinase)
MQLSPERSDPDVVHYLTKPLDEQALFRALSAALEGPERVRWHHDDGEAASCGLYLMREGAFVCRTLQSARAVADLLASACPEPRRVAVGLSELLVNAVEHGNLGISYEEKGRLCDEGRWEQEIEARLADPANAYKVVSVRFARESQCIRMVIKDQGQGFDWEKYLDIDPARVFDTHGRGIAMSRMLSFDSIEYRGTGNKVEVTIRLAED